MDIMIKSLSTFVDMQSALDLISQFIGETPYGKFSGAVDREHLGQMLFKIMRSGKIWLAYAEDRPVGILIAILQPNMWIPKERELREILWYVVPGYRSTSLGGRLFSKYQKYAEELLEKSVISGYFTTKMTTTRDLDLTKHGFNLVEQTYMRDKEI